MLAMSVIVFVGVYAIGNPLEILIPPEASQDIRADTIRRFGLDRPLWEQYLFFLSNALQGDFGRSFLYNVPVLELILGRLPATLELTLAAVIGAVLMAVFVFAQLKGLRPQTPASASTRRAADSAPRRGGRLSGAFYESKGA